MLPLDALPDENPNTPLAPVVPAFTDRSTALPLLVAVPSPKPNDKAQRQAGQAGVVARPGPPEAGCHRVGRQNNMY